MDSCPVTDSRSALLAAAAEEFAKHGRQGTRLQSIVRRAGVNERMIYHHFGSKDGLYAAVLEAQLTALAEQWRPVVDTASQLEPYDAMRMILTGFLDILTGRPLMLALWLHEALAGWTTMPPPTVEMLPGEVREVYERGQRAGVFRADCPFEVAYATAMCALFALPVIGPRFASILDTSAPTGPARLRDQVVGQLIDGMTTGGPSAR